MKTRIVLLALSILMTDWSRCADFQNGDRSREVFGKCADLVINREPCSLGWTYSVDNGTQLGVKARRKQDREEAGSGEQSEIRYLRRGAWAHGVHFYMKKLQYDVEDIQRIDIDASYDGRKWFHLLGKQCISKSPRLQIQ